MAKKPVIRIIAVKADPKFDKQFREWYVKTHVPMLMKYPGLKKTTQCDLLDPDGSSPGFLALFEFESEEAFAGYEKSPEFAEARKDASGRWSDQQREVKIRLNYRVEEVWQK
jgi:uncharacterized protein (TIGR02118 family)